MKQVFIIPVLVCIAMDIISFNIENPADANKRDDYNHFINLKELLQHQNMHQVLKVHQSPPNRVNRTEWLFFFFGCLLACFI